MKPTQSGAALVVGLLVLTLVMLLGLAGVGAARIELLVAQNETFRENAATAASAGIEMAITQISNTELLSDTLLSGDMPGSQASYEVRIRFVGFERALPQAPAAQLAGAHFEIVSTGSAARNAVDRQRAGVMLAVDGGSEAAALDCEPVVPRPCHERGDLERLYWQRLPLE